LNKILESLKKCFEVCLNCFSQKFAQNEFSFLRKSFPPRAGFNSIKYFRPVSEDGMTY
jgi:hypothetical protein